MPNPPGRQPVTTPIRHRGKWRIRWLDEAGKRRSEVHDDHRTALRELRAHEVRVEEIKRDTRRPEVPDKTFEELADCAFQPVGPETVTYDLAVATSAT